jgi:rhodanese-related sulfurtransferase
MLGGEYNEAMARLLLTLCAILAVSTAVAQGTKHTQDSLEKVRTSLDQKKAVLLDVREPAEWKQGHLQDADLVPLSDIRKLAKDPDLLAKHAANLPKTRTIYLHCASGVRVLSAAYFLEQLGYDARPLAAGYADLLEAGFKPAPKSP